MNQEKKDKLNKILKDLCSYVEELEFEGQYPEEKFNSSIVELRSFLSEISDSGEIDLSQIYISDKIAKPFFLELSKFTTLETLRVRCPEYQRALAIFVEALSKLSVLTALEIKGGILLSGEFNRLVTLLDNLVNLKTLILESTYLDLLQNRIGTKQVDYLLILAMNSKYGLEKIVVTSPNIDPADLELFTTAIRIKQKIVDKQKFQLFLMSKHKRVGQDSLVRFLVDDIIETIWNEGSFIFDDIKNSQITRLLQRVDPEKFQQLFLLDPDQVLVNNQREEIIEHLVKKFVQVAPSPKLTIQSATAANGSRGINANR